MSESDTSPSPPPYIIRPLSREDYDKGYCSLLSQLTEANFTKEEFKCRFDQLYILRHIQPTFIYVVEHVLTETIVASASCATELKFIHQTSSVGHIEDVVVDKNHRGKGLSITLIESLKEEAIQFGCYKLILDCVENLQPVYKKAGFERKDIQMACYLN